MSNVFDVCGDGRYLVSSVDADQAILFTNISSGKVVKRVIGHLGPITCLAVSDDGMLVTGVYSCQLVVRLFVARSFGEADCMSFNIDKRSGSLDHTVLVWDTYPVTRSSSLSRAWRDEEPSPDFPLHTLPGKKFRAH